MANIFAPWFWWNFCTGTLKGWYYYEKKIEKKSIRRFMRNVVVIVLTTATMGVKCMRLGLFIGRYIITTNNHNIIFFFWNYLKQDLFFFIYKETLEVDNSQKCVLELVRCCINVQQRLYTYTPFGLVENTF